MKTCSVNGCGRGGKIVRGMCPSCYRMWLDRTPPDQRPIAPRFARQFWDFVRRDGTTPEHAPQLGACWLWTGPHDRKGYGRWARIPAHRHSWCLVDGPIADGLWVLHHCDNPPCVNPDHLYLGTVVENARDAVERDRMHRPRKRYCKKGHLKEGDNLRVVENHGKKEYLCRQCNNEQSAQRQREARDARGPHRTLVSEAEKAVIVQMRRDGVPQRSIVTQVGRCADTVRRVLKESAA